MSNSKQTIDDTSYKTYTNSIAKNCYSLLSADTNGTLQGEQVQPKLLQLTSIEAGQIYKVK
jgi:hypothetical protein